MFLLQHAAMVSIIGYIGTAFSLAVRIAACFWFLIMRKYVCYRNQFLQRDSIAQAVVLWYSWNRKGSMKDTVQPLTLEQALAGFLREMQGLNTSEHTITAYTTDLTQFVEWLHATNLLVQYPRDVRKLDISALVTT